MAKKRIFAAIELSDAARNEVGKYVDSLGQAFPGSNVRWERNEKLHITVRFAGGLSENELAAFIDGVEAAVRVTEPFTISVMGTGSFSRRSRDAVLWLALQTYRSDSEANVLEPLADLLRPASERPKGRFKPHLTIARSKYPKQCQDLITTHLKKDLGPISFDVRELVVYQSELLPTGSVYRVISRHKFGTGIISGPNTSRSLP